MFAPPTVKVQQQAAASLSNKPVPQRSMSQTQEPEHGWNERAHMPQQTIGNQATPQDLLQSELSPARKESAGADEKEPAANNRTPAEGPHDPAWSFSRISIYPTDQVNRPQTPSPLAAPPLPGVMHQGSGYPVARAHNYGDMKSAAGELDPRGATGLDRHDPDGSIPKTPANTGASPAAPAHKPVTPATPTAHGKATHAPAAPPTVTLPAHVRASSSPATMADRIPPRAGTPVSIGIAGLPKGGTPVEVSVDGSGAGNGTVTLDGAATATLAASKKVTLRGDVQTDKGKGGNLTLVAKQGAVRLAQSGAFSVSSVPQNYTDTFASLVTGDDRGFTVQDGWSSDSGVFADLDETEISEVVEYGTATGCFAGSTPDNSHYLHGNHLSTDTHSWPAASLTSKGDLAAKQACMFNDNRAGSSDVPMTNSGYTITRKNVAAHGGKYKITTSKNGANVTAKGITTKAGSGSITKSQDV